MYINDVNSKQKNWKILTTTFVVMVLLAACKFLEPSAPERSFDLDELLLEGDISSDWELSAPVTSTGDDLCTTECLALPMKIEKDKRDELYATQIVYRFQSIGIAQRTFKKVYLPFNQSLELTNEWNYQSQIAEQTHFGCDNVAGNVARFCQWGAQYKEFIVSFGILMPPGKETQESLALIEDIIIAIDERMAQYLNLSFENIKD